MPTTAVAIRPGTVRLTYGSAWDRDNERLTYDVFRDGTTLLNTFALKTNFWTTPQLGFTDTNVPGGNHTYQVRVTDPWGNTNWTTVSNVVSPTASATPYAAAVLADSPSCLLAARRPGRQHGLRLHRATATRRRSPPGSQLVLPVEPVTATPVCS